MIDYGSRIRAVCDYLETVPGTYYNFAIHPNVAGRCGCVIGHGIAAGIISLTYTRSKYNDGIEWLTGITEYTKFNNLVTGLKEQFEYRDAYMRGALHGESAKQTAISNLRAYADKHYPVNSTPKHEGIPACVLELFETEAAA